MSSTNKDEDRVGFYVRELDAGCYSVRLDLVNLVNEHKLVKRFHQWMLTRSSDDKVYLYLENGATNNLWLTGGWMVRNVADLIKAIQLSPAYENTVMLITQMLTGAASYLILATPRTKWGPLGFVSFDGWMSGKETSDYDQNLRSDIAWIKDLFRKGVKLGLYNDDAVKDHEAGRSVYLGLNKK